MIDFSSRQSYYACVERLNEFVMKSYTDLEQSKKLVEILPLESADMFYDNGVSKPFVLYSLSIKSIRHTYPCWSLAALIGVLPNGIVMNKDDQNGRYHFSSKYIGTFVTADNPVDACYEMMLKLHELKLL